MVEVIVEAPPHNPGAVDEPKTPVAETVTLSKEEHAELQRKADASSQNFERLKKEREAREAAEAELARLQGNHVPSSLDDDKMTKMESDLADIKAREARREVIEAHPQLKDLWNDFESFHAEPDNKGMSLKTAAKAFLTEKGILISDRKGLERPTGGDRAPIVSGMSADEVRTLRETDYKKYREMVKNGQIKIAQ